MRLALLILVAIVALAGSAQGQGPPKLDNYGDPLPAGALVRLGTVRLRQGQSVEGVAFSWDGKLLASCGWDDRIRLWDVATGRPIRALRSKENDGSFGVAFSPDGKMLAAVSAEGYVRRWDVESGQLLSSVKEHSGRTYGVAFSPDGLVFATAGSDAPVRLWDTASGKKVLELTPSESRRQGDSRSVTFSPDGNRLASATGDGVIYIWNLTAGSPPVTIVGAHPREISSLVFTADGKQLITSGVQTQRTRPGPSGAVSEIKVWNAADGSSETGFVAKEAQLSESVVATAADGAILASAHHGKIILWDVATKTALRTIDNPGQFDMRTHALAMSRDGSLLAAASTDFGNKIDFWNVKTGERVLPQTDMHTQGVLGVSVSPDGMHVATASADKTVRLWDAVTGRHVRKIDLGSGWARYVEFFPDGQRLAVGGETRVQGASPSYQGAVKIFRTTDGELLQSFLTPDRVMCGALSQDGSRLAAGIGLGDSGPFAGRRGEAAGGGKIIIWDTELGGEAGQVVGLRSQIEQLAFSRDGDVIWSTSQDRTLRKADVKTGRELESFELAPLDPTRRLYRSQFVPSRGDVVLSFLENDINQKHRGALVVRAVDGNRPRWQKEFAEHWPAVLAVSRDGQVLAAHLRNAYDSSANDRILLWSLDDGREIGSFEMDDGNVRSLVFSPDGTRLISGMELGDTLIWDVSTAGR